ncbi:bifunctional DNA primase/polymerase [Qaidamihabitans albus]|uniref:bifunctional DNA primase/polymerase n=1 Tax=Qaidamihabitans albus TaxID=2795733 RepID=UPI0018F19517|nr:bifunctional DNA primase/polymerase [Qaidamihabitans albus]
MGSSNALQDWALYLAGQGWRVFPLKPGSKRPAVSQWETRATTDTDRIARCWATGGYNIGLATGPSGLVVLDLDTLEEGEAGHDGAVALAELAAARGVELAPTYTVTTPSGGTHRYYRAPEGVHLRNTASHLAPRVDTRAEGGYVVAPGSILPSGGYELADDTEPAELPAWLVQALAVRPAAAISAPREITVERRTGYAAAALRGECQRVSEAARGQHNATLASAAFNLGQLIGAGLLEHTPTRSALLDAATALVSADCDCTPTETARVTDAGLAAGARHPRGHGRKDAA